MADTLFDSTVGGLNAVMNFRLANQNVISSNIANADTPGYHAQKMEFETALRDALGVSDRMPMEASDPEHIIKADPGHIDPVIYDNPSGVINLDGNTVDRASEMVSMAENELQYNAATELLRRKLGVLKYAINEGGGR
ncbi:MAG: flagellar basal body rod protein FlgB [Deltaproteobacteria bacterium]|nr:flagellar basal body rod protein FlgB [Deltaproteobacteria bacterium]